MTATLWALGPPNRWSSGAKATRVRTPSMLKWRKPWFLGFLGAETVDRMWDALNQHLDIPMENSMDSHLFKASKKNFEKMHFVGRRWALATPMAIWGTSITRKSSSRRLSTSRTMAAIVDLNGISSVTRWYNMMVWDTLMMVIYVYIYTYIFNIYIYIYLIYIYISGISLWPYSLYINDAESEFPSQTYVCWRVFSWWRFWFILCFRNDDTRTFLRFVVNRTGAWLLQHLLYDLPGETLWFWPLGAVGISVSSRCPRWLMLSEVCSCMHVYMDS